MLDGSKKRTTVEVPLMPGSTLAFRAVDAATGEPVLRPDVRVTSKSGHLPPNVQFSTPGSLMKIENVAAWRLCDQGNDSGKTPG